MVLGVQIKAALDDTIEADLDGAAARLAKRLDLDGIKDQGAFRGERQSFAGDARNRVETGQPELRDIVRFLNRAICPARRSRNLESGTANPRYAGRPAGR